MGHASTPEEKTGDFVVLQKSALRAMRNEIRELADQLTVATAQLQVAKAQRDAARAEIDDLRGRAQAAQAIWRPIPPPSTASDFSAPPPHPEVE
jgi:septal ring factor EnvC (AmiA/AmiB activator)